MTDHRAPRTDASAALLPKALRPLLARAAQSGATVLLVGESGTGKGLAARALHAAGPRRDGPFVEVALAALAPSLLEAELFGHEEGAYTGARGRRRGRFQRAQGGTLVLDGVEGLPGPLQAKLLRVLQEREVEPLGSEIAVPLDVRVVATAAADLPDRVRSGAFREDLYYRLAVLELPLPPLRRRADELPAIARVLARRVADRLGVSPRPLDGALSRLADHPWPGNLRELENRLERWHALATEPGAPLGAAELDELDADRAGEERMLAERALDLGLDLRALETAVVEEALRRSGGSRTVAARRLGLSRRALERRRRADAPAEAPEPDSETARGRT